MKLTHHVPPIEPMGIVADWTKALRKELEAKGFVNVFVTATVDSDPWYYCKVRCVDPKTGADINFRGHSSVDLDEMAADFLKQLANVKTPEEILRDAFRDQMATLAEMADKMAADDVAGDIAEIEFFSNIADTLRAHLRSNLLAAPQEPDND